MPWRATPTRPSRCSSARPPRTDKDARVSQNLALVLGLQGKYDEARVVAARDLPADNAAANVDYVRRIVMLEPRPMSQPQPAPPSVAKAPATASRPAEARPSTTAPPAGRHRWPSRRPSSDAHARRSTGRPTAFMIVGSVSSSVADQPDAERNRRAGVQSPDALVDGCRYAGDQQRHHRNHDRRGIEQRAPPSSAESRASSDRECRRPNRRTATTANR